VSRRMLDGATVAGMACAVPALMNQDELWDGFFREHYRNDPLARRLWAASGVQTRHGVVNPISEDVSEWSTGARMRRYLTEGLPLGKEAVGAALADAGLDAADVGLFTVASCTGYATPGVDILLARDLGMSTGVQRLVVGHMGCYAAIPALGAAADFVRARGRPAVLLCLELTSLHLQPAGPTATVDQVISHSLFSDAATAVVLVPDRRPGLELLDVIARTDVATSDHMTWDVTDLGFRMGLSPRVPDVLARHARPVISELLAGFGMGIPDVAGWAVHPGGPRILDVVAAALELPATALAPSRDVLRRYGNCSSATVLLVLAALGVRAPGEAVVAMAFGPGLTLYAAVFRQR